MKINLSVNYKNGFTVRRPPKNHMRSRHKLRNNSAKSFRETAWQRAVPVVKVDATGIFQGCLIKRAKLLNNDLSINIYLKLSCIAQSEGTYLFFFLFWVGKIQVDAINWWVSFWIWRILVRTWDYLSFKQIECNEFNEDRHLRHTKCF